MEINVHIIDKCSPGYCLPVPSFTFGGHLINKIAIKDNFVSQRIYKMDVGKNNRLLKHNVHAGDEDLLDRFFSKIQFDPKIGTTHIALFVAMVQRSNNRLFVSFYGRELRPLAKICSTRTYFKVLRDLMDGEYIDYKKGQSRWEKSQVHFIV